MTKTYTLPVVSFGSEVPEPDLVELASWVSENHGREGDIISFMLVQSMRCQGGISSLCAGGLFYTERMISCMTSLSGMEIVAEPAFDPEMLGMDGRLVRSFGREVRLAVPASSMLGLRDSYFDDNDEFSEEISRLILAMMRVQRDAGVSGHVLIADRPGETETEILSSRRVRFYIPDPSGETLATVMEHQRDIAVPASGLSVLFDLMENYEVRSVNVVDAEEKDLLAALEHFDIDEISVGGYCTEDCGDYWPELRERAIIKV